MKRKHFFQVILFTVFFMVFSCSSEPVVTEEPEQEPPAIQEVNNSAVIQPEPAPAETEPVEPETLNEEEFKEAETDIAALINDLNAIINARDFTAWQKNLSENYITYFSDPEVLKAQSESPLLVKNKIVLRTLEDYFNYVVVGSRKNVKLDELKVIDRNRIKAYMYINGNPVIIYELVKIDGHWKIGKF